MSSLKPLVLATLFSLITACGGGGGGGSDGKNNSNGTSSSGSISSGSGNTNSGSSSSGSGTSSAPTTPIAPEPVSHTITLSWTLPSTREDGSALPMSQLSGYEIYYYVDGSPSDDTVVPISGGSTQSTQVTLTNAGNYYFAIAAVDSNGLVSNLSNYVSLAVN